MKLEVSSHPSFSSSPFPLTRTKASDTNKNGEEVTLPANCSIPDYIRAIYGINKIDPVIANFPFLDRDSSDKAYDPARTDKYVFSGRESISKFKNQALSLIKILNNEWTKLGLPLTIDKERKIQVPDTEVIIQAMNDSKHPYHTLYLKNKYDIGLIVSNLDIMKKSAIQRTVVPGWWVVSYDGRNAVNKGYFTEAIAILIGAMKILRDSPVFKRTLDDVIRSQGDPLDTAVGYPFFSANIDKEGNPISKLLVLDKYQGLGNVGYNWDKVKETIASKGTTDFERKYVFAIAPIRRIQPGYKKAHMWFPTSTGLHLDVDERGHSTNRVAWMAPYLLNLLISPIQSEWKAIRKLIPGLYQDGESREMLLKGMRDQKPGILESDFSNYDRTIPNDVIREFMLEYSKLLPNSKYWYEALLQTQADLPIIWSDQIGGSRGRGWVFQVQSLALLSGLKITSEIGTFMNLLINIAGWLKTGLYSSQNITSYLTQAANASDWKSAYARQLPRVLIQSDDTLLMSKDSTELQRLLVAFKEGAKAAGIKAQVELGDKFLMRHMTDGMDRPVLARIWQNTLSNEEPPESAIKFLVGLAVRTDGLGGWKTFDPFKTGKNTGMTEVEQRIALAIISSLLDFVSTAHEKIRPGIDFISLLLQSIKTAEPRQGRLFVKEQIGAALDEQRNQFLTLLAREEEKLLSQIRQNSLLGMTKEQMATYLYNLHKNSQSPSSQLTLEYLKHRIPELSGLEETIEKKESAFYRFAMRKLGLKVTTS